MKRKLDLYKIVDECNIEGETFVPFNRLFEMALSDIFGEKSVNEGLDQFIEVYREGDNFGIVAHHFDQRVGFTLAFEDGWKEFQLSIEGSNMKIDQLKLFDQLRNWNFKI